MNNQLNGTITYFMFFLGLAVLSSASLIPNPEPYYLSVFQDADVAGVGIAVAHQDNSLVIDVKNFWAGSFPTNPIAIDGAFGEWTDGMLADAENHYAGKKIVFFATTNEWKAAVPRRPGGEYVILDNSVCFTNIGGFCPPKFLNGGIPTWFALETNDVEHLAFFSNIVKSVVVARDRDLLYTTLRDAIKSDESGGLFYGGMSSMPMWQLLWTGEETNLVQALYDPLLSTRFRRHALSQLKMRFDWPATNTVPEL